MALREIRILGDEILRKKCRKVEKIDEKILDLIQDMMDTMFEVPTSGNRKFVVTLDYAKRKVEKTNFSEFRQVV